MTLTVATRIEALTIRLPVRNAIDAVWIRLAGGLLQSTPDKIPDVVIERLDFSRHRELGVLGGQISRLAEPWIVAGHFVDAPTLNPVIVVRTQQHFRIHVPVGNQPVVPLGWIAVLAVRQKCRALLDK